MAISRETELLLERSGQLQTRSAELAKESQVRYEIRQALYESNKRDLERIRRTDRELVLSLSRD